MMTKNMGSADRLIRLLVVVAIIAAYFMGAISGTIAIVGLIAAGIFLLTSLIGTCPLYLPFGLSTLRKN
ncbi:DUF2892 domain-containing protein [Sphingorhabdus arenilitoris]|uniref:DUF2892 domain-containing protein n=1 Tax=Sphingorhabdus arenilitoris TaxID=1490041 RepID=A0ABV8RHF4_9SPHN